MKLEIKSWRKNKMPLPHERHPLPPHHRRHVREVTHEEIMDRLEAIEDLLRRIEER